MPLYSANDRLNKEFNYESFQFDLIVIGGGITGAGIALDAASRGMTVLLVEKNDFAFGTSSRSTKLIHGGLRYLKQFDFSLVREVGTERAVLHKNAPHLILPEKMLLPIIENGTYGKTLTSLGLFIYDFLASVRISERKKMLSKEKTIYAEPLLRKDILKGAGLYTEYRTDDSRLTYEIIKTASDKGAVCFNYMQVNQLLYQKNQIQGIECYDNLRKSTHHFKSHVVVNATGPWVDSIRQLDHSLNKKHLHLTKGVHLVVSKEIFPVKQAVYFDAHDGRMVFAIPGLNKTYFGTTDTDYYGDIENPQVDMDDVEYLLKAVKIMFPDVNINDNDIESSWVGLRPLIHESGKGPTELSRKDEVFVSESGLISIAGGKLTGYRKMAERVVNKVCRYISSNSIKFKTCQTETLKIHGSENINSDNLSQFIQEVEKQILKYNLTKIDANYLVYVYGANALKITENFKNYKGYSPHINLMRCELDYCLKNEAVFFLEDFLVRRTGKLYFDLPQVKNALSILLEDFSKFFGLNTDQIEAEKQRITKRINQATLFVSDKDKSN